MMPPGWKSWPATFWHDLPFRMELEEVRAKAAELLGARPLSRAELIKRLVEKGGSEDDAVAAADWLEDLGALDDRAYAAAIVRHYGGRSYGPARIREELRRRGIGKELWDEALESLPGPEDALDALDALVRKKAMGGLDSPKEVKRVSDALLRRGFSWGDIKAALSRYTERDFFEE